VTPRKSNPSATPFSVGSWPLLRFVAIALIVTLMMYFEQADCVGGAG
jgi:hypothetical protein